MSYDTYFIPANYTDAGRLFGLFEIRNAVEAIILGLPVLYLGFTIPPLSLTARIICAVVTAVPVIGFGLTGIGGECLSRYIRAWRRWRRNRQILTYRGECIEYRELERTHIRRQGHRR
jgi:hypothetical protein